MREQQNWSVGNLHSVAQQEGNVTLWLRGVYHYNNDLIPSGHAYLQGCSIDVRYKPQCLAYSLSLFRIKVLEDVILCTNHTD